MDRCLLTLNSLETAYGGHVMALEEQVPYDWRGRAFHLAWQLDRAHSAVQVLGEALEEGDRRSARRCFRSARESVGSVAREVKSLRSEQPSTKLSDEEALTGPALVLRGSGASVVALDVMVEAMAALSATQDVDDTDVLVSACIDAQRAYEDSTAVVKAASRAHGPALAALNSAFCTAGEVALRKRVTDGRVAVHAIKERVDLSKRRST